MSELVLVTVAAVATAVSVALIGAAASDREPGLGLFGIIGLVLTATMWFALGREAGRGRLATADSDALDSGDTYAVVAVHEEPVPHVWLLVDGEPRAIALKDPLPPGVRYVLWTATGGLSPALGPPLPAEAGP